MTKAFVIAECGINHQGSLSLAKELITAAKFAGADAVKFQAFTPELNAEPGTELHDILVKTRLTKDQLGELMELANSMTFICSPFDIPSIEMLLDLELQTWKIPSGKITDFEYLETIGEIAGDVILSTGMSTYKEISDALEFLGTMHISILHCCSAYPTPCQDVNLKVLWKLMQKYPSYFVGLSDHTLGIEVPIAAVAMGAHIIEKHLTFDRPMDGPDHKASLTPGEFSDMVRCIRNVEAAMGDGQKRCMPSEKGNLCRRK
jgi:N,N'-diacetyllegionaminate synthase